MQSYRVLSLPRWAEAVICHVVPQHQDRSAALTRDLHRLGEAARSGAHPGTLEEHRGS